MGEQSFEQMLARLLKQDYAAGTEGFRDALLARCLDEVRRGATGKAAIYEAYELDDSELDLLAAAGDTTAANGPFFEDNRLSEV